METVPGASYSELMNLIKGLQKDATTSGISTATGLNFYYLEPKAKTIYPVFYPLLASIPRAPGSINGQLVGGTSIHWKAITAVGVAVGGVPSYPALSEGNRNAAASFQEKDYNANYKYLGQDGFVTFAGQQAGLGFDDNLQITQTGLLNLLMNQEEMMLLFGNSGSGGNGFQLGTPVTPTGSATAGGAVTAATYYVRCIALTGWGVTLANATGCQLPFARQNMDNSADLINGGTSIVSASSAGITTSAGNLTVTAATTAIAGAMGYAWYIGTANTAANQFFYAITPGPSVAIAAIPSGTNQNAGATSNGGTSSFATDNSANTLDFDGETTWAFNYAGASSPSYWKDLNNAKLTANGDGTIAEFETVLNYLWSNYKITIDRIWIGGTLIASVTAAILSKGSTTGPNQLVFTTDGAGKITGGTLATNYRSKFVPGRETTIELVTHPWLPQGVIYFELINNPYPAAGASIPAVRRVVTLEDHFGIKWPYTNLTHQTGVYVFETLAHYIPFGQGILTGVGQ